MQDSRSSVCIYMCVCMHMCVCQVLSGWTVQNMESWFARTISESRAAWGVRKERRQMILFQIPAQFCEFMQVTMPL